MLRAMWIVIVIVFVIVIVCMLLLHEQLLSFCDHVSVTCKPMRRRPQESSTCLSLSFFSALNTQTQITQKMSECTASKHKACAHALPHACTTVHPLPVRCSMLFFSKRAAASEASTCNAASALSCMARALRWRAPMASDLQEGGVCRGRTPAPIPGLPPHPRF